MVRAKLCQQRVASAILAIVNFLDLLQCGNPSPRSISFARIGAFFDCYRRLSSGDFDLGFNHARYKDLVKHVIEEQGFECRAPALSKGDVLFWNGKTIHGSLDTSNITHNIRDGLSRRITSQNHIGFYSSKARSQR